MFSVNFVVIQPDTVIPAPVIPKSSLGDPAQHGVCTVERLKQVKQHRVCMYVEHIVNIIQLMFTLK